MFTVTEYSGFQRAYDFFNAELFDGCLPQVLVTLQRRPKMRGYFWAEQFQNRGRLKTTTDELALNPDQFLGRSDEDIVSTLVHEMAHVWQQAFGKPGRRAYHNQEWAEKMKALGLHPSDTGAAGGKETGERMSHYILADGRFARACGQLQRSGFRLNWQSRPVQGTAKKKKQTRSKFTCPLCGQNAWAKPDAQLICGTCHQEDNEISLMVEL